MSAETDDIRSPFYRKGAFRYVNGERVPVDTIQHHHVLDSLKTEIGGRVEGFRQGQRRAHGRRVEEHREYERGRAAGRKKRAYEQGRKEGMSRSRQVRPGSPDDIFRAASYAGDFMLGPARQPTRKSRTKNDDMFGWLL